MCVLANLSSFIFKKFSIEGEIKKKEENKTNKTNCFPKHQQMSSLQRTSLSLFFIHGEDEDRKESNEGAQSKEGEATETCRKDGSELSRMLEEARSKYQTYRYDRFGLQETFNSRYVDMEQQEDNIDKAEKRIAMRLNEHTRRVLSDGLYLLTMSVSSESYMYFRR